MFDAASRSHERTRRAVLRCIYDGADRVSGAVFCARSETRDRRFGVRWPPSLLPVPAVSGDSSVRRRCPSGDLADRECCMRPDRHFSHTCWRD